MIRNETAKQVFIATNDRIVAGAQSGRRIRDAVVVSTARSAIGTAFKGSLVDVDPYDLATVAVREAVDRSRLDPALIDDIVIAESRIGGGDIARYAPRTAD
jgi:acetyl-CoA acetyltransferase